MHNKAKTWLVIAIFLVLIGCIIFGGVMTVLQWDFSKLSTVQYETNTHELQENFKNISILADTADITFVPDSNAQGLVVCHELKTVKHSVTVQDDTLTIAIQDNRKWYEHIGIFFGTPKITVYLPQSEYGTLCITASTGDVEIPEGFHFESMDVATSTGDIKNLSSAAAGVTIKASTGNIHIESISAGMLDLSVTTGKVTVTDVVCQNDITVRVTTGKTNLANIQCKNVLSSGNTGDLSAKNVIAAERLSIHRSTGDVMFDSCDASEIFVETDTGDVTGSFLTDKVFIAQTDTGRVDVPKTTVGGKCEIQTNTGDIKITIN